MKFEDVFSRSDEMEVEAQRILERLFEKKFTVVEASLVVALALCAIAKEEGKGKSAAIASVEFAYPFVQSASAPADEKEGKKE